MTKKLAHFIFLSSFLLLMGCNNTTEMIHKAEEIKIQNLLQLERKYHVDKMVKEFVNLQSKNFISVSNGVISKPTKIEGIERFGAYFSAVDFEAWDDITPPHITFSNDYTMAYAVVHKNVVVTFETNEGGLKKERSEFAWLAVYKKYKGKWLLDAIASTNTPNPSESL